MVYNSVFYFFFVMITCVTVSCAQSNEGHWPVSSPGKVVGECPSTDAEAVSVCEDLDDLIQGYDSKTEMIAAARDYVHRLNNSHQGGSGAIGFDWSNPYQTLAQLKTGEIHFSCGGMSESLKFVLAELGIASSTIQLATQDYIDGVSPFETHVTVRAFDPDLKTYYISDPTFNTSLSCRDANGDMISDVPLSYGKLKVCLNDQGELVELRGDYEPVPGQSIEDYQFSYNEYLAGGLSAGFEVGEAVVPPINSPKEGWLDEASSQYSFETLSRY